MRLLITILFLITAAVIPAETVSGYIPIRETDDLNLRNIPVHFGTDESMERIRQMSEGPFWALNLSGGSARAFAHIGVIKRLEEEGLRPDAIITNSMGSIVGMAYAAGMRIEDIEDMVKTIKLSELFDIVLPFRGGLIDVRDFEAFMYAIFGEYDISRTPIPVFVVTEDIKTKRQIILSSRDYVEILKASFALPFYFEPVDFNDFRLIDGGTTSLVPVESFRDLFPNMVVSSTFYAADLNLSNPLTILNVTMDISKSRSAIRQIKEYKPFLIRCNVENISFMAFDEGDRIISLGYESCDSDMESLKNYLASRNIYPSVSRIDEPEISALLHERWMELKRSLNSARIPVRTPGWTIKPEIVFWKAFGSDHYLMQEAFPILNFSGWRKNTNMDAAVFYRDENPGVKTGFDTVILGNTLIELEYMLNGDTEENSLIYRDSYLYNNNSVVVPLFNGRAVLAPGVITEIINPEELPESEYYVRPGVYLGDSDKKVFADLRYLFHNREDVLTTGISAETTGNLDIGNSFLISSRVSGKYTISGEGMDLTFNDFFRSRGSSFFTTMEGKFPSYLILNSNFAWKTGRYLPTIGELLSLKNTNIFTFFDLLLTDIFEPESVESYPTAGIGINLESSIIGLKPYIYSFSLGWDFTENNSFLTISFGDGFGKK